MTTPLIQDLTTPEQRDALALFLRVVAAGETPDRDLVEAFTMLVLHSAAPVEWRAIVRQLPPAVRRAVTDTLDAHIFGATRLRGYVDNLANDSFHDRAVKDADTLVRRVRQILGYASHAPLSF